MRAHIIAAVLGAVVMTASPAHAEPVPASTPLLARIHLGAATKCPIVSTNLRNITQTGNALVVGAALYHSARAVGVFAGGPLGLIIEQSAEDLVVHILTRHASCRTRAIIDTALAASSFANAATSSAAAVRP